MAHNSSLSARHNPRSRSSRIPSDRPILAKRRASLPVPASSLATSSAQKSQRSSKTTQKLVLLPSDPQTKQLLPSVEEDAHGYETDAGVRVHVHKSAAERMSKAERQRAGYKRMTAYCVAEGFRMKLLASFVKREHNVTPRTFDDALYAMYHLPLLPGYGPGANIRSSAPAQTRMLHKRMSEAEENGYEGSYFDPSTRDAPFSRTDGYIQASTSPVERRSTRQQERGLETETENEGPAPGEVTDTGPDTPDIPLQQPMLSNDFTRTQSPDADHRELVKGVDVSNVAEVVFFEYGVVVFFGLDEIQERSILEDVEGMMRRKMPETDWEVEECHYDYDSTIAYPRIYNDFFTFKTPSHLLTLSIAHAVAQSTLLARYETLAQDILADPRTTAIPQQLAAQGALQLSRTQAMRLTGRLFRLRRDVVLGGNVLDVPELFWSEASLRGLYDAVREYFEIGSRVGSLNERLVGANDLLDAIHDHLNSNAMERITWIIIWLIMAAILVELGEIIARLVVHATTAKRPNIQLMPLNVTSLSREEAIYLLEQIIHDTL